MPANENFYSILPVHYISMGDLLVKSELFADVPSDWHVVITDIVGSTKAVFDGKHETVNLVATGSIVAVLNIAFGKNIIVPFFFGGDGATFLVPHTIIDEVMSALYVYRTNTLDNFDLELRAGKVSVKQVYENGHHICIAKFSSSISFSIPVILGKGLTYAEHEIKSSIDTLKSDTNDEVDLTGMQCRWDKIAPPKDQDEVLTLIVAATSTQQQSEGFRKVMMMIDELYGSLQARQPISVDKLKQKTGFKAMFTEMRAKLGKIKWLELVGNWFVNLYGLVYFQTENGKRYLNSLVELSETLVMDGRINTVISGPTSQRIKLLAFLDEMEFKGQIIYGYHTSSASIMSCYVRDLKDDHVHFVDGSEGGYTSAAKVLKAKLKSA
ncbi:MAG: DUF3095 domain-containing protein [Pedobacter sp.]|nr:MAG: DUF3095 domain-containing protein [Pedobacter sp.]